jgi:hypothetical protein
MGLHLVAVAFENLGYLHSGNRSCVVVAQLRNVSKHAVFIEKLPYVRQGNSAELRQYAIRFHRHARRTSGDGIIDRARNVNIPQQARAS